MATVYIDRTETGQIKGVYRVPQNSGQEAVDELHPDIQAFYAKMTEVDSKVLEKRILDLEDKIKAIENNIAVRGI